MFACQGASFTKISTFSAPGTLRANHARASRHLGVCFGGTLNLEGIYGHFGCFTLVFGHGTFSRVGFLGGFYSSFSPWIMKTLESHSDLTHSATASRHGKTTPKRRILASLQAFHILLDKHRPRAKEAALPPLRKDLRALDSKRWKHWRINGKNGDLQNYTCASYVNKK